MTKREAVLEVLSHKSILYRITDYNLAVAEIV